MTPSQESRLSEEPMPDEAPKFEAWWAQQDVATGDPDVPPLVWKMIAWNGWLARARLAPSETGMPGNGNTPTTREGSAAAPGKAGTEARQESSPSHGGERSGCPCTVEGIEPCSYACSCAHPFMSGGCQRCAAYGSLEQRQAAARRLISSATRANMPDWMNEALIFLDAVSATNMPKGWEYIVEEAERIRWKANRSTERTISQEKS
jgi:hypothetical protein